MNSAIKCVRSGNQSRKNNLVSNFKFDNHYFQIAIHMIPLKQILLYLS